MVALYAAALDKRLSGASSFCGFTPMRTDTAEKTTGGTERLWKWHALQPRLGLYGGRESDIPYDFEDILSLIAPRPVQIVSPVYDREADVDDIAACVEKARRGRGKDWLVEHLVPEDYNRFQSPQHAILLDWLKKNLKINQIP